jgi:hypothetical protein
VLNYCTKAVKGDFDEAKERQAFFLLIICSFPWGCYSSNLGGEPGDGEIDAPGEEAAQDDPGDIRADDPLTEPLPEPCSGSDRLNLRYVDPDGNPMPDLAVAVRCLDHQYEGRTDGDGRVGFVGLDLASFPVDVTCVGENFAYTLTDVGGPRTVPDPLQIPLEILLWLSSRESRQMQGDILRTRTGSEVLVSTATYVETFQEERYDLLFAPVGNDLPMSVFEYTLEGDVATPVGFAFLRYDSPPEGVDGPDAAPQPAEFQRATVRVEYDIRDGSPFHFLDWENFPRTQDGVLMHGVDSDENVWLEGIMTSWISGVSHDTAELAWTEEALGEAVRSSAYVSVSAQNPTGPLNYYSALRRGNLHEDSRARGSGTLQRLDRCVERYGLVVHRNSFRRDVHRLRVASMALVSFPARIFDAGRHRASLAHDPGQCLQRRSL